MTVMITKFSEDKTKIDWVNNGHSGNDVLVSSLLHSLLPLIGGDNKTVLIVEDNIASPVVQSFYPMSGGVNAQMLHRNHLLQDTFVNVQSDATARSIEVTDKTQAELIELILQDECAKKQCSYYQEEA